MRQSNSIQLSLSLRGWCQNCIADELCGAQYTECYPFRTYPNEVLHPGHPDLLRWIATVRGLCFDDVIAQPGECFDLPAYVAGIDGGGCGYVGGGRLEWIALTLGDVFSSKQLLAGCECDIREKLQVSEGTKVVLLGIGKDDLLERMWGARGRVMDTIAGLNFDLVTAFNYSIWHNEPRFEHLVNLKRSLLTFEMLQDLGVPVIPHVYWYNRADLQRWAEWLHASPVRAIALNLQTGKSQRVWEMLLEGVQWIGQAFPRHLEYLVIGPTTFERMRSVLLHLGRVTFCNKDAYIMACKRRFKTWDGARFGMVQCDAEPGDIFLHNVALFDRATSVNPPPPFALLDGFEKRVAVQARLPGISTAKDEVLAELPRLGV